MRIVLLLFSIIGAGVFALLLVSTILTGNWTAMALATAGLAVALPFPGRTLVASLGGWGTALRAVVGVGLICAVAFTILTYHPSSIYQSDIVRTQFHAQYDEKMQAWPLPFEDRFLNTDYGTVHVVEFGLEGGPPMLLLHASGVASWSWRSNAAALGKHFRVFAVDTIGDAGKSEYADPTNILRTREDQAALYDEIIDQLGIVETAVVVGASEGGFIASNLAAFRPERVECLILLGPMGYSGAMGAVLRIMGAQYFPLEPVQDATFRWAFSDAPAVIAEFNEWFNLLMSETLPIKVAPLPLSAAERQSIAVRTLFVFGSRDNLVGDPGAARALVSDMLDVKVVIIDAGHLMGVERPSVINSLILDFAENRFGNE